MRENPAIGKRDYMRSLIISLFLCVPAVMFCQTFTLDSVKLYQKDESLNCIKIGNHVIDFSGMQAKKVYYQDLSYIYLIDERILKLKTLYGSELSMRVGKTSFHFCHLDKDSCFDFDFIDRDYQAENPASISLFHTLIDSSIVGITYLGNRIDYLMFFDFSFGSFGFKVAYDDLKGATITSINIHTAEPKPMYSPKKFYPNITINYRSFTGQVNKLGIYDYEGDEGIELVNGRYRKSDMNLSLIRLRKLIKPVPKVFAYQSLLEYDSKGKIIYGKQFTIEE